MRIRIPCLGRIPSAGARLNCRVPDLNLYLPKAAEVRSVYAQKSPPTPKFRNAAIAGSLMQAIPETGCKI